MTLAAAAVWCVGAYQSMQDCLKAPLPLSPVPLVGISGLMLLALLFLLDNVRYGRGVPPFWRLVIVVLEGPCALMAYWGLQNSVLLALLVIVATQYGKTFQQRTALLLLVPLNLVLLLKLPHFGPPASIVTIVTFSGFEIFAMLMVSYAVRERLVHEDLLRINGELMSTRHLLHQSAKTEERLHLSRELHDVAGHKLTALKLQLRKLTRESPAKPDNTAALCLRLAEELLVEVRAVVGSMRNEAGVDLNQSLRALITGISRPNIELQLEPNVRVTDIEHANTLLRCAQEGLTNALRHSDARHIVISLSQTAGGVTLTVEDNGCGQSSLQRGNGLIGMQERLKTLGGVLEISSSKGRGLRLGAWLPQENSLEHAP